ncbi:MAG: Rne/Rng family ribonuclease [Bacteroidales bacterium]|jgi:ribonuclease G|nr:Rne/Rng family ribonuclease [Bacteroidales bacterium]
MSESEVIRELIVASHPGEVQIALLEDKKLVEIHREKSSDQFSVGDIYLGKIKKINPGLNAAFVGIGSEKDAFLHYLDLGIHARTMNEFVKQAVEKNKQSIANFPYEPEVEKNGKIGNAISSGQQILIQIAKEPISTKGPRVTTEISMAGRYLVLVPFMDKITVSQKIKSSQERKRLKKIVQGIKPKHFGIIIRTVAENKQAEDIENDLQQLHERWKIAVGKLHKATAPAKIAADLDKTSALIRDLVNESFNAIYVDNPGLYNEIKSYLKSISFDKVKILNLYKDKQPIFEHFNVALQIKSSFGKIVTIKNGVYLIIEHTEAMHVIDVNSGKRVKSNLSQEENAMEVNLIAAAEIARQLRLRDMGGIIAIDFIDLAQVANRSTLHKKMMEFMIPDKARHTILPVNKFGVMQITRQRIRQATIIETTEICPSCQGTGKIKASILLEEEVDNTIEFLITKQRESKITMVLHPYVYSYFTKGLISKQVKWFLKYRQWIKVKSNADYNILEYKFLNADNEEIVFWKTPHITN